ATAQKLSSTPIEHVPEGPEKASVRRPVGDSENDVLEHPCELPLQRCPKVLRRPPRVVAERSTPPRAQHQRVEAVSTRDGEHSADPHLQQRGRLGDSYSRGDRGRASDEVR